MSNNPIQLEDVEAQIVEVNDIPISQSLFAKLCLSASVTIVLAPFAICDTYFAGADDACMYQNKHNLSITLHSYLFANGIIMFTFLGGINLGIFAFDINSNKFAKLKNTEVHCIGLMFEYIMKLFETSWLITGCVLYWGYTNTELCKTSSNDYLYARFIIAIVCHVLSVTVHSNKRE